MLKTKRLQTIVKGFANHRRIQIIELLSLYPEISVSEISNRLKVNFKTISEHARRLNHSGLILKRYKGQSVLHVLSPLGKDILKFLRILE
ncbi:winged helix-turn-helix transcriptional regulator [Candidatus Collierbacteria bacterium]|nr:winged helix-turn-helix transcriptional regulator [Candidatus Collierbacteria bacterium]